MKTKAYINSEQADFLKSQAEVEDLSELNIHATAKKKTSFNGTYSIVFHDSIKALSQMGLKPNAYKITLYLFSIISMGNIIINFSKKKIAFCAFGGLRERLVMYIMEFATVLLAILSSQHLPQTLILPWGLGPGMQSQRRENAKGGAFHGFDRIAPLPKYRPVHDPEH